MCILKQLELNVQTYQKKYYISKTASSWTLGDRSFAQNI